MKNHNYILIISLVFLLTSCGISEDCFKGNGNRITQIFPLDNFTKIKVHNGVGLVIKEGSNYEVKIETSDNIMDALEVRMDGDMLVVKDNSTCNIVRDYGQTVVYVTLPDGINLPLIQELELYSKTEQKIQSEGTLHSTIVRLFSIDLYDGAGTGDFHINVANSQVVIEGNNVSNYYVSGTCGELLVNFYFGNGRFYGANLYAQNVKVYHRGSNDMFVYPVEKIEGTIAATGNVVLENVPPIINVEEVFRGQLIY
jgi:hypothetical protein